MRFLGRSGAIAALLGVFFLALYLVTGSSDLKHNGDTDLRYQTTQAIVDFHRFWIAHPLWLDTRVAVGTGHHLFAFYAPGQSTLMVPFYIAGKFLANHLGLPYDVATLYASRSLDLVLGALLGVLFYLMARSIGYSVRTSAITTLIFGTCTAVWPDAQSALEQTQVDLFLLLGVYGVWRFVAGEMRDRRWLLLAGTSVGLAVFTRYDAAIYLGLLPLFPTVLRLARRSGGLAVDWLTYILGLAPWLLMVGLWDWVRFGSPFLTGLHERTFGEPFWQGLSGLTISPGKGLIWYVPLLLLLPWAARSFWHRVPSLAVFFAAIVLLSLLFYANVLYWHGDPAWGPRYLYVALPYLILPLGEIVEAWWRQPFPLRVAALSLILVSLVIQVAAVSVTEWRYWYRLEALQQQGSDADSWSGQPFHWGATRYHYYWTPGWSPIPIQVDDVYQVLQLGMGESRYRLIAQPDPYVSNPVWSYPVNSLSFWWVDPLHPLLTPRERAAIAIALTLTALSALGAMVALIWPRGRSSSPSVEARLETAPSG